MRGCLLPPPVNESMLRQDQILPKCPCRTHLPLMNRALHRVERRRPTETMRARQDILQAFGLYGRMFICEGQSIPEPVEAAVIV
jgi:hypothetical protein